MKHVGPCYSVLQIHDLLERGQNHAVTVFDWQDLE